MQTGYTLDKLADGKWHILYWRDGEFVRYVCQCADEQIGREQCSILNWLYVKEKNARLLAPWMGGTTHA